MSPQDAAAAPAFVVEGVSRRYGDRVALAPVSLRFERGETVAVVGPSGSGKTTLLNLLGGVLSPSSGSITVLGRRLDSLHSGRERAERIGMMHQQLDLVPNLSVIQNVLAGNLGRWGLARSLLSLTRPRDRPRADEALRRVGLGGHGTMRTARLSGGEQQRVALARLLVQNPHALLADEPVSSLDPARAEALIALLVQMAREGGHTLVTSLHGVELALHHMERVIGLRDGVVVFDCHPRQVSRDDLDRLYAIEAGSGARAEVPAR